jgi:hypothetical protein
MGLPLAVLRLIVELHKRESLPTPLLTLGVQDVHAPYDTLVEMFKSAKYPYRELSPEERLESTSFLWRNKPDTRRDRIHPRTFFRMLGIEDYSDLDLSPAEQPALRHDLNTPVPNAWHGQYGMVLDSGTLEHLFDIRIALSNLVALTRVGGRVLHISPMSGWTNHGFFQLSPCLFYDFYGLNGFEVTFAAIGHSENRTFSGAKFESYQHSTATWELGFPKDYYLLAFHAVKRAHVWPVRIPTQGKYQSRMQAA